MGHTRTRFAAGIAAAALAGGGVGAGAVALGRDGGPKTVTAAVAAQAAPVSDSTLTVGQIAKTSSPAVVEVDATSSSSSTSPFPWGGPSRGSSSSVGTGFVYDLDGHIVTNQHVVDGATTVSVKLADGSTFKATVVGTDASTDLAVLKIDAPAAKLHPLALGDSSKVAVGDGVVAIGNPFGLDGTVTSGIVSAVNREISAPDETPITGAIQTDAAINHGNSGGPLFGLDGRVIGVTAQIESDSGGSDGVGFAIPSNTVKAIAAQLISSGKAEHALLGVSVRSGANGVVVAEVQSGTAADSAGLKAGDVIVKANGETVTSSSRLSAIVAAHRPGDELTLTIRRDGATRTLTATLGSK